MNLFISNWFVFLKLFRISFTGCFYLKWSNMVSKVYFFVKLYFQFHGVASGTLRLRLRLNWYKWIKCKRINAARISIFYTNLIPQTKTLWAADSIIKMLIRKVASGVVCIPRRKKCLCKKYYHCTSLKYNKTCILNYLNKLLNVYCSSFIFEILEKTYSYV